MKCLNCLLWKIRIEDSHDKIKKNPLGFNTNIGTIDTRVLDELKDQFKPEFINRVDDIVSFNMFVDTLLVELCPELKIHTLSAFDKFFLLYHL